MNKELLRELQQYLAKQVRAIRKWVKPDPSDNVLVQVLKLMGKSVVILLLLIFSPVICLILTIVFFAAF